MDTIAAAVARLDQQLPLRSRQAALPPRTRSLHREILWAYADHGTPPDALAGSTAAGATALSRLAAEDLIVLDGDRVAGAYPFSSAETPHHLLIEGNPSFAMCSLDAVAIAPVFAKRVIIRSSCAVTGEVVTISQDGRHVETFAPGGLRLGVRWQRPDGCAAHSMCREMVFLADVDVGREWKSAMEPASLFTLQEGIEFGVAFFAPLVT